MSPNILKEPEKEVENKKEEVIEEKESFQQTQEPNDFFVRENILKNEPLYAEVEQPKQKEPEIKPINLFSASTFQSDLTKNLFEKKADDQDKKEEPKQLQQSQRQNQTNEAEAEINAEIETETEVENDIVQEDQEYFEVKPKSKKKNKFGQFRIRLFTAVFCAVMAIATGWVITNTVRISNVNKAIESVQTEHSANIIKLKNNMEKLDDLTDNPENNSDYEKIEKIITVQPLPLENPTEYQETTNWFDSLCNWISSIFGG